MSTKRPPLGKFGRERLENRVFPYLGRAREAGIESGFGSDFNTVELDEELVLVVSTDPLAASPQLGWHRSGRLALHVITADVAVSGVPPSYLLTNWNLPPTTSDETFEKIWKGFTGEADRANVTVIGGHTGRYEGSSFPTIGAGTAFGLGRKEELLPDNPSPGDKIYLLDRLGLEAAAIFSFYYPEKLSNRALSSAVKGVKKKFDDLKPTTDLNWITSLPGVVSLHDIAEGGLLGGLQEMLSGENYGALIKKPCIEVDREVASICRRLDLDPLKITSIGSGVALVSKDKEDQFRQEIERENLPIGKIGKITAGGKFLIETNKGVNAISEPIQDEFWARLSEFATK